MLARLRLLPELSSDACLGDDCLSLSLGYNLGVGVGGRGRRRLPLGAARVSPAWQRRLGLQAAPLLLCEMSEEAERKRRPPFPCLHCGCRPGASQLVGSALGARGGFGDRVSSRGRVACLSLRGRGIFTGGAPIAAPGPRWAPGSGRAI